MSPKKDTRIDALLDQASKTHDWDELRRLALAILAVDPQRPEGLILLADSTDDNVEGMSLLREALKFLPSTEDGEDRDTRELRIMILERLGQLLLPVEPEEALRQADLVLNLDQEKNELALTLKYAAQLELGLFRDTLELFLCDGSGYPIRYYARALALYHLTGGSVSFFQSLWDALEKESEMAFYGLDLWPDPPLEDGDEWDYVRLSSVMITPWLNAGKAYGWLMVAALLFGYLTDRIPDALLDEFQAYLDTTGFFDEMNRCLGEFEAYLRPLGDLSDDAVDAEALRWLRRKPIGHWALF